MEMLLFYILVKDKKGKNIMEKLREFLIEIFKTVPKINDKTVHTLAEKINVSKDVVEDEIYSILSSFLNKGKWAELNIKPKVDAKELKIGKEVEMEHTNDLILAERIALDHLTELDDYYTRLAAMEKIGKEEKEKEKLKQIIRDVFKECKNK